MKDFVRFSAIAGALVLGGVATGANAATVTPSELSSYDPPGTVNAPLYSTVTPDGLSGPGTFIQSATASITNVQLSPYAFNTDANFGSPYSVLSPGSDGASSATYNLNGAGHFNILWGSPDSYNHVTFYSLAGGASGGGSVVATFAGSDLGCYISTKCKQTGWDEVRFAFDGTIGSVVLGDDGTAAFEFGLQQPEGRGPGDTPLPGALPLFASAVAGFGGLLGWRKRKAAKA